MISNQKPEGFKAVFEATGCYVVHDGNILFLKRLETDDDCQDMWGTPGGKIENETPKENILREIEEETGIKIDKDNKNLEYVMKTFVIYPKFQFIYHIFKYKSNTIPKIILSEEHSEFKWLKPKDALKLNLVPDEDWCIKQVFSIK
jgi:8-oxo-dGTP pyrophosphatase MutT (NUDIX family)